MDQFSARRAIERLRSGLFDPTAVAHLTAGIDRLQTAARIGLNAPGATPASGHLCICGSYGQGKSHSLHVLRGAALERNFAVSLISLDPRELPFHRPRVVYQALMASLRLPDGGDHRALIARWKAHAAASDLPPEALLPADMPRLFSSVFSGLTRPVTALDNTQRKQKKHRHYHPSSFTRTLNRAVLGTPLPIPQIRRALRYRRVPDYSRGSMAWRGAGPVMAQIRAMAALLQQLGLAGWVVLLDEGEAIAQVRSTLRTPSWAFLSQWLTPAPGLLPVFAFTEDFLWRMEEDSDNLSADDLNLHRLGELSAADWAVLCPKLTALHGRAYGWSPPTSIQADLLARLVALEGQETRLKLKALVDELDVVSIAMESRSATG